MNADPLAATLQQLLGPVDPEVSCEACFAQLDRYVDAEVFGDDPDAMLPGMRAHLVGCPACAEEYQSLKALLADEHLPHRHPAQHLGATTGW